MNNYFLRKTFSIICILALFGSFSVTVFAQETASGGLKPETASGGISGCQGVSGTGLSNPLKGGCSLYDLVKTIANDVILPIGGVLVVFFIIYSGFLLVIAAGNEEKLKTAKRSLMWTLIGAAILLGAWVIALAIENTVKQITAQNYEITPSMNALIL